MEVVQKHTLSARSYTESQFSGNTDTHTREHCTCINLLVTHNSISLMPLYVHWSTSKIHGNSFDVGN